MNSLPTWFIRAVGMAGLLSAAIVAAPDNLPGAKYLRPWAVVVSSFCTGLIGLVARQNNVSSETAGAIKPAPQPQQPPTESPK